MKREKVNRLGLRYGRLLVIDSIYIRGLGTGWKCRCDCGTEIYAASHNLQSGNTGSCGCLHRDNHRTHGKTKDRVYVIWKAMHQRCGNPNANGYENYGGRGIKVCDRWEDFNNFYADMGDPSQGLTLERIDNEKGYGPDNCRWATYSEQLLNRRNNHVVEAFGKKQTITEWAREYNLPLTTLRNRLTRAKWSPEKALTVPLYGKPR